MLQTIRDRFTGLAAATIIAIVAVALTITLVDTSTFSGSTGFAARVNGEDIPLVDFREIAQQQLLQQEELTRAELSPENRRALEVNVLESLVRNRVVAQYVREIGFRVGNQRVVEHIRGLPAFQVAGQFSTDGYLAALASRGVSPAAFEEERRTALQIEELQSGLLESAFYTPTEFRRFVVLEGERRRAAFGLIEPRNFLADLVLEEAEVKAFYDANPARYETEESAVVDYVEVRLADIAAPVPKEEELRAAYEAEPGRFASAEQRRARHILIAVDQDTTESAAAALAADLKKRLDAGEDFGDLARRHSDDPGSAATGGELGWAGRGTYVPAFEEALFSQQLLEISAPVKTEFGYHLIQLLEVRAGTQRSFDEVREELAGELQQRAAQDRFYALSESMDDAALQNPGSLDAVAAATGASVRRIEGFTREGGGAFGANRAIIDAVFSAGVLENGENSPVIESEDGVAVVLRVAEHSPVKLRPLEEVRPEVESAARAERAAALVAQKGESILESARAGGDLATLLSAEKAQWREPVPLARNSEELPRDLLAAIFRAPRPAPDRPVYGGLRLGDGSFGIYRIDEVIAGRPEDIAREQRDARKSILARQSGVAEVTALAVDLRNQADVVIAPNLFDAQESL